MSGITGYAFLQLDRRPLGLLIDDRRFLRATAVFTFNADGVIFSRQRECNRRVLIALLFIILGVAFMIGLVSNKQLAKLFRSVGYKFAKAGKIHLKLVSSIELKVEYVYVLNDWFKKPEYKNVLDYIHSVNCHYKFNELPLAWLGLPTN